MDERGWLNILIDLYILFDSGNKREKIRYYFLQRVYWIPLGTVHAHIYYSGLTSVLEVVTKFYCQYSFIFLVLSI